MILKQEIFSPLPPVDTAYASPVRPKNSEQLVLVILDDDPTGTQTSHDVLVITDWSDKLIKQALTEPIFFILTNTRSLDERTAYHLIHDICYKVQRIAVELGKEVLFVSRTDSTLRGHFKIEPDAVANALKWKDALRIFCPAFFDGGRYTINNQHYVQEGEQLIPASQTSFAKDSTFGYQSSDLYQYILEKDDAIDSLDEIFDLGINEIRELTINKLVAKIIKNKGRKYLIVNGADQSDLNKVAVAIHAARNKGLKMIIRSGAAIIPSLSGMQPIPVLDGKGIRKGVHPGLIIVGSYVPKTTEQLDFLLEKCNLETIEVDVKKLISVERNAYIFQIIKELNRVISGKKDCVIYTNRKPLVGKNYKQSLEIVNLVADGLISIVSGLEKRPSFIMAKGGITSSDIASKSLEIKRAMILGQLLPGVPVWKASSESKYPDMPYVIFPGNVGNNESVYDAYKKITEAT